MGKKSELSGFLRALGSLP
ncbi:hypothetical protein MK292_09770 [Myxococcota bacterium]|nr:hypothetical protein [Myxococcota bacterium]